jgi:hypothetical protein
MFERLLADRFSLSKIMSCPLTGSGTHIEARNSWRAANYQTGEGEDQDVSGCVLEEQLLGGKMATSTRQSSNR